MDFTSKSRKNQRLYKLNINIATLRFNLSVDVCL